MPRLVVTKNYRDGTNPTEPQLDAIKSSIEVFFNNTKLGDDNLQDNIVDPDMIAAEAVTAVKIDTNAVTNAKVGTAVVGSDHIQDEAVTTAKIVDANVTMAKYSALNKVVSSSTSAVITNTSPTFTDVSGYSCTITTHGGPVVIMLQADGTSSASPESSVGAVSPLCIKRDSTAIGVFYTPGTSIMLFDAPAAGEYTYQLFSAFSVACTISNLSMVVFEPR